MLSFGVQTTDRKIANNDSFVRKRSRKRGRGKEGGGGRKEEEKAGGEEKKKTTGTRCTREQN